MKKTFYFLFLICCFFFLTNKIQANKHEHRAVWMSSFTKDWPTAQITSSNVNGAKRIFETNLDSLQKNNFTTIYYHARVMADAAYNSKYEPWSHYISPVRGEAPAFDPFAYVVESSHKRGIEVYAWINPYRYCLSKSGVFGASSAPNDYENSHPDWLIKYNTGSNVWTILNPALPEVQQRIVDVVADIMDKYDIDGVVFDDYFYQNGLPLSADSKWYNEYKSNGGTLAQMDWRRKNVNDMVRKVHDYIKSTKPWVRFGIGPAGVAATNPSVASKYGVRPCPAGSDWQYNGIASDPLAWLSEGTIDFISPQVYWPIGATADFASITTWWYEVASKFNRHCYVSQNIGSDGDCASLPFADYEEQIRLTRNADLDGAPGYVFFPWGELKYKRHASDKKQYLMGYLRDHLYNDVAFTPAMDWCKVDFPGCVSNVSRSGRDLTWNGPANVRYAVYAIPKSIAPADFHKEAQYLVGISYDKKYTLPNSDRRTPGFGLGDEDVEQNNYAVAVLDRYGNEYNAAFEGKATIPAQKPELTYPGNNEKCPALFMFKWTGGAEVSQIVIAEDSRFSKVVVRKEVAGTSVPSSEVYDFKQGKTYYWKVITYAHNSTEARSGVASFSVDAFRVLSPANGAKNCEDNLTVKWMGMQGSQYSVQIASDKEFKNVVFNKETTDNSLQVPEYELMGNVTYYLKVAIVAGSARLESPVTEFTVKNMVPPVPQFVVPARTGVKLYSNSQISVRPQRGIKRTVINVGSSTSFSPRGSYKGGLNDFNFVSNDLSTFKLGASTLKDGKTYYLRAQFEYYNEAGATVQTAWTPVMTFVYSSEAGVNQNFVDALTLKVENNEIRLSRRAESVDVYNMNGELVVSAKDVSSVKLEAEGVFVLKTVVDGNLFVNKIIL